MQDHSLEWLYRWSKEPKRLFKRYVETNSKFVFYLIREKVEKRNEEKGLHGSSELHTAKGGITSVVNGYRNSQFTEDYDVRFIETYCDGSVIQKTSKALSAYLKFIYTALFWKPNRSCP